MYPVQSVNDVSVAQRVQFTFVIPAQAGIQDIKNTPSVIAMSPQLRLKKKSIFFNRQL